jgi:hypothetical protein
VVKNRSGSSGHKKSPTDLGSLMGIPSLGSGGFDWIPLESIGRGFRDAISYLKEGPQDDISTGELLALSQGLEAAQRGDLKEAITKTRQVFRDQTTRQKWRIFRRAATLIRWRKQPTLVETLLSMLLSVQAVERANEALEEFKRKNSPDIISQLRAMTPAHTRGLLGIRQLPAGFGSGYCDFCGQWALGELRQGDGKTWKVCHTCADNAQSLIRKKERAQQDLKKYLQESHRNLEESLALNPKNEQAKKNIKISREIIADIGE